MSVTARQFLEHISSNGILSEAELSTIRDKLDLAGKEADAEELVRDLIRKGKLTRFQAANIYHGRGRGLVFGEYVVLDKIGAGGMGHVFKARHRRMKREVALKVLPPHATSSKKSVLRFYQEVEVAAKLSHPNIVTAYDAGQAHGMHYLAMELVDGQDLATMIAKQGRLNVEQAVNVTLQAARGLAYAHSKNIIHRDIKPSNLLVDRQGMVKILDLGLARLANPLADAARGQNDLTESGQVMGTVDYMSPEQAADTRTADHRTDIYSLGCTLYRLLTAQAPYGGETMVAKLMAHRDQPIPHLRVIRPEVPDVLDRLFQKMVVKRPEDRIQPMSAVVAALETLNDAADEESSSIVLGEENLINSSNDDWQDYLAAVSGAGHSMIKKAARHSATAPHACQDESAPKQEAPEADRETKRKRVSPPGILIGGAVLVSLLLVGIIWGLMDRGPSHEPPQTIVAADAAPLAEGNGVEASSSPATTAPSPAEPGLAMKPPATSPPATSAGEPSRVELARAETTSTGPPSTEAVLVKESDGILDLLKLIEPARDSIQGVWRFDGDILVTPKGSNDRLQIPVVLPETFDLTLIAERVPDQGTNAIVVHATAGQAIVIDGNSAKFTGIDQVDGRPADKNATTFKGRLISEGSPHTIVISVRPQRVRVLIDEKSIIDWAGNLRQLVPAATRLALWPKHQDRMGLSVYSSSFRISKLELRPLDSAELTAELTARAAAQNQFFPVNLMPLLDVKRDIFSTTGTPLNCSIVNRTLRVRGAGVAVSDKLCLQMPVALPSRYQLWFDVETWSGDLAIGLPLGNGKKVLIAFTSDTKLTGQFLSLADVDGIPGFAEGNLGPQHRILRPGERQRVRCSFARQDHEISIRVTVDDVTVLRFTGDEKRFREGTVIGSPGKGATSVSLNWDENQRFIRGPRFFNSRVSNLQLAPADWYPRPVPTPAELGGAREALQAFMPQVIASNAADQSGLQTAEMLRAKAAGNLNDPPFRFVCLDEAIRIASEAGDIRLTLDALNDLASNFAVDRIDRFGQILAETFKSARTPSARKKVTDDALRLIEELVRAEDFAAASALIAAVSATRLDAELVKDLKSRAIECTQWLSDRSEFLRCAAALDDAPSDAEANRVVGRYLAFMRRDWSLARYYFARCADEDFQSISALEEQAGDVAEKQVEVGDRWWTLGAKATTPHKWIYQERASYWYRRAYPRVDPKIRTAIERRATQLTATRKTSGFAFTPRHPLDATKIGDHWYKLSDMPLPSWIAAKDYCEQALGGWLAMPKSQAAVDTLGSMVARIDQFDRTVNPFTALVGASDLEKEGNWLWIDGTPVGQVLKNGGGPAQNAGALQVNFSESSQQSKLIPHYHNGLTRFLCEWDH